MCIFLFFIYFYYIVHMLVTIPIDFSVGTYYNRLILLHFYFIIKFTYRLRYAVIEAIKYRKQHLSDKPYEEILILLKSDLTNGPFHVFGDHSYCKSYFCKGSKEGKIVHYSFDDLKIFKFIYV
jgi:hypothetical protein